MEVMHQKRLYVVLALCIILGSFYPKYIPEHKQATSILIQKQAQESIGSELHRFYATIQSILHPTYKRAVKPEAVLAQPETLHGSLENTPVQQVKVGPIHTMQDATRITQVLLDNQYSVTMKIDQHANRKTYNAFVQPAQNTLDWFKTVDRLNALHIEGTLTTNYS